MRLSMDKIKEATTNEATDGSNFNLEKEIVGEPFAYGRDIECLSDGRLALIEAGRQKNDSDFKCLCGCDELLTKRYSKFSFPLIFVTF